MNDDDTRAAHEARMRPPHAAEVPGHWGAVMGWADVLTSYPMIPVLYPTPTAMSN
jgi:hypothetical protein